MVDDAENIWGKRMVKITDKLVNWIVLIMIILLVIFACYAMWDSNQVYEQADAKQYEIYKPGKENTVSFDELQKMNDEVFGWLTVYGTNIDYPITQGQDNMKYVNTNAFGKYSLSGSIFLDSENNQNFEDFNSILYGHHMEKQAMFGEIDRFTKREYFDEHKYGNLYFNGKDHGLEFFAFLHTDAYDGRTFTPKIQGKVPQEEYLNMLLEKAMNKRDIGVTIKDHIVLLSTCSSDTTNGRDILVGRMTDKVYEDTFKKEGENGEGVDKQLGIFAKIPLWLKILMIVILLILLIMIVYINKKGKKRGR